MENTNTNTTKYLQQKYKTKIAKQEIRILEAHSHPFFPPDTFYVRTKFQWMLKEL